MSDDFDRRLQAWMDSHESPHDAGRFGLVFASLDQRHRTRGKWFRASVAFAVLALAVLALASLMQLRPPDDTASRTASPAATSTALESPMPVPATLPAPSPATSATPRATLAPVDGPLLASAELGRSAGLTAHLKLLWPRAGGDIDVVEERAIDVRSRAISEGLYADLLPRPQSDQVLVNLRGFGSWLWSPGAEPEAVFAPDELRYTRELRWSPDGRLLAGMASWDPVNRRASPRGTVVVWDVNTGDSLSLTSPAVAEYHEVAGWTADSQAVILARTPVPAAQCYDDGWLAILDVDSGDVTRHTGTAIDAAGSGLVALEVSVATGYAAVVGPEGGVELTRTCADTDRRVSLDLPAGARALSLEWTLDGRGLLVLADYSDGKAVLKYSFDASELTLVSQVAAPDEAEWISAASRDGEWVAIVWGAHPCPSHAVVQTGTGLAWLFDGCRSTVAFTDARELP